MRDPISLKASEFAGVVHLVHQLKHSDGPGIRASVNDDGGVTVRASVAITFPGLIEGAGHRCLAYGDYVVPGERLRHIDALDAVIIADLAVNAAINTATADLISEPKVLEKIEAEDESGEVPN